MMLRMRQTMRRAGLVAAPSLLLQASLATRCEGEADFRLVQYNVRRLTGDQGEDQVAEVAASLRRLSPSVLCLNEVDLRKRPAGLQALSRELGLEHIHFFGHAMGGNYGNAVLSKFPFAESRNVNLEGGTKVEHPKGSGQIYQIHRGLTAVQLLLPDARQLTVASTHWDHMTESERCVQALHSARELEQAGAHLIVGDFNALRREDYSQTEWAAAEARAQNNGWVPPCDAECISHLTDRGYVDSFKFFHYRREASVLELPASAKFSAPVDQPMYRIDYAFVSAEALKSGLRVANAFIDGESRGSDHFPLVVDFSWENSSKF